MSGSVLSREQIEGYRRLLYDSHAEYPGLQALCDMALTALDSAKINEPPQSTGSPPGQDGSNSVNGPSAASGSPVEGKG